MTSSSRLLCITWAVLLVLTGALPSVAAPEPRRVLLLHSFDGQFAPLDYFTSNLRREMSGRSAEPIEFYEISLQPARFTEAPPEAPILDFILAMFPEHRLDLVISIGGPAAAFAHKNRARIFPDTPMLLAALDVLFLKGVTLAENETAVAVANDQAGVIEDILKVLPRTRNVFVVLGNSPLERFWRGQLTERFRRFQDRLTFLWSDGLSFPEILERCATLPPDSAILYFLLSVDARNVSLTETRALPELHAVANAPIFGLHSSQLGRGVVGGEVMSMDLLGENTAGAALRILRGESPRSVQIPPQLQGPPVFDSRELRRWSIREDRLPPGSIVRFREPTLWDRYRTYIVAGAVLWLLGTLLLMALLFNLVQRRRAEQLLRESRNRLQGILDTALEGILTVDERGIVESVNAATEKMFGYAAPELIGQPVSALITSTTGRRKDGSTFPLEIELSEVTLPERRIYTHFVRDVTERMRIQQMDREFGRRLLEAQEAERARVARDLHDDVTQRIAGLVIEFGRHDSPQEADGQIMSAVRDELTRIGEDVHALAYRLHPALLDRLGLARALEVECERFLQLQSIPVSVAIEAVPEEIPRDSALALFRIAQEALSNVSRHARASAAELTLKAVGQGLQLSVTDAGVGFDSAQEPDRPSLGLASMRERVRLLGGELSVQSQRGRGTTVRAWIPLGQAFAIRDLQ